jgi:hypothetical protein
MTTSLHNILSIGALVSLASGCGGDMTSMSDDFDGLMNHQGAFEAELADHHRAVLATNDLSRILAIENAFGPASLGHMDDMDHRLTGC